MRFCCVFKDIFYNEMKFLSTFLSSICVVESYNPVHDNWTLCPSLNQKKGSLSGAALNGKIFAVGGGNGVDCFSDVEMLDLDIGRWIPTRSMLEKVKWVYKW